MTPIQGPIFIKNGTVPVVPLFSYPSMNNGTFVQIPVRIRVSQQLSEKLRRKRSLQWTDISRMLYGGIKLGTWLLPEVYVTVARVASQVD